MYSSRSTRYIFYWARYNKLLKIKQKRVVRKMFFTLKELLFKKVFAICTAKKFISTYIVTTIQILVKKMEHSVSSQRRQ